MASEGLVFRRRLKAVRSAPSEELYVVWNHITISLAFARIFRFPRCKPEKKSMATRIRKTAASGKVVKAKQAPRARSSTPVKASADENSGAQVADSDASRQAIRLSFLIHDVSRMRRAAYDQFMKPLGITRAQWWVLAHLSRHDGMMQTQLADVLDVGKASLGDVIENLESRGWVERRSDPADKRAKRVYLTRPAQTLIKRMTVMEHDFNSQILADISTAERAELLRNLQKIKLAISQFNPSSSPGSEED